MQAVIAFCHFCESHGPRVIFTTQPLRNLPYGEGPSDAPDWPNESSLRNIANNLHVSEVDHPELIKGAAKDREARCTACTSIGDRAAYLSADKRTRTTFVSTQVSFDDGVLDKVKYACLRSLTIEVGTSTDNSLKPPAKPGGEPPPPPSPSTVHTKGTERDGNVFFGDAQHGYTMSLTFRLEDSRARGFLRLYSFIVVSSQMQFILSNHDALLNHLHTMKNHLQRSATRVFHQEMDGGGNTTDAVRPENAPRANMMPQGWFRRRMNVEPSRDLRTIVGDEQVWKGLHRQMLWTLRSESLRLHDGALEGLPTQDMLVIRELDTERVAELSLGSENEHEKTLDQLENLRRIARGLGMGERDEEGIDRLLYHTITGGQIVILGSSRSSIRAFLLALTNLLPIGCLRVNSQAAAYAHPNKYNLLGLPKGTEIPEWADCLAIQMEGDDSKGESDSLEGVSFSIVRRPSTSLPSPLPSLLTRYKQLVVDEGVTENVLEATIRSTRDQWLSRTKILFQLMRQPTQYSLSKMLLQSRAALRDRDVMFFWLEGLSKAYRSASCPSSPH